MSSSSSSSSRPPSYKAHGADVELASLPRVYTANRCTCNTCRPVRSISAPAATATANPNRPNPATATVTNTSTVNVRAAPAAHSCKKCVFNISLAFMLSTFLFFFFVWTLAANGYLRLRTTLSRVSQGKSESENKTVSLNGTEVWRNGAGMGNEAVTDFDGTEDFQERRSVWSIPPMTKSSTGKTMIVNGVGMPVTTLVTRARGFPEQTGQVMIRL